MLATTQLNGTSLAPVDICKTPTPAGPVPIPYPNIAKSETHVPVVVNHLISAGFVHNLLTSAPMTLGDQPGVLGGVVSGVTSGTSRYLLGSFKVFWGTAPAARLTSVTMQNCAGTVPNTIGVVITPSQVKVVLLG
jgi:hypothetical protein